MSDTTGFRRLEARLLSFPAVFDCALVARTTSDGSEALIAYVSTTAECTGDDLAAHLRENESGRLPDSFVFVSSVPRTRAGEPDEAALSRVPIVEDALAQHLEERLEEPSKCAVVVRPREEVPSLLHLADVMPEWSRRTSDASGPARSEPAAESAPTGPKRPSLARGAALHRRPDAPLTLSDALRATAGSSDAKDIVYLTEGAADDIQTYPELLERACCLRAGLVAKGLGVGDRVLFQLERPSDFLPAFWACVLGGMIPIPFAVPASYRQDAAISALEGAWEVTHRPFVLTDRAHQAEVEHAAASAELESFRCAAIEDCLGEPDGGWHQSEPDGGQRESEPDGGQRESEPDGGQRESEPDDLALLMLTSGSTGRPKAVQLTHRSLLDRTLGSQQLNGFSRDDVTLNWMPLDHVAGLIYFHIRDTYLGCRQIQLPTETVLRDPLSWIDCLDRFRVTITFAPNFAFGLVNDCHEKIEARDWDLSSVRFILNGAEAIVARTARQFLRLLGEKGLSPSSMHPAWGMSETSSGVTYSDRFDLERTTDEDAFVVVGRPIPGISMRIVDDQNGVVDEGRVGHLQVEGSVVTKGYFRDDELTQAAYTEDGWFDTGDLGVIEDGYVTITGREKDVVVINSVKYYSHAIEAEVEDLDGVVTSYTAACAVRDGERDTDQLAVFFHPESFERSALADLLTRVRAKITTAIGVRPDYLVPVEKARIAKTSLGKIQRTQLANELMAGEFDDALRDADLSTGSHVVPAWFFEPVWVPQLAPEGLDDDGEATVLLFVDTDGVGDALMSRLSAEGHACIGVTRGALFERLDKTHFQLDPGAVEHFVRLVKELGEDGVSIDRVVHLWDYRPFDPAPDSPDSPEDASVCLLRLTQALAAIQDEPRPVGITVAAAFTARVEDSEPVDCERTPVIGWVRSIPQELPWARCAHVDLPYGSPEACELLARELESCSDEREIALRTTGRFVARLERAGLTSARSTRIGIDAGDLVVVTGGLGGIGFHVAREVLSRYRARVLLTGRTPLDQNPERGKSLAELAEIGGQVAYEAVDVVDAEAMAAVVSRYEASWGAPLAAVFHLAGEYRERLALEQSVSEYERMLAPRNVGARNLYRLLERRGHGLLVLSSTVASFFGGANVGAYAASNRALDGLAEQCAGNTPVRVFTFQWSNWDDVGQARGNRDKDVPRSRGYLPIPAEDAIRSLRIGLSHDGRRMLVGLDGANRHVRPYVVDVAEGLQEMALCCADGDAPVLRAKLAALSVSDRFGTTAPIRVVSMSELPLTPEGTIDRGKLASSSSRSDRGDSTREAPRGDTESRLARIWAAVLGVPHVYRDDSFFELGGDSLAAVRAQSQIREGFGAELSLRTLFESTRLAELALEIEQMAPARIPRENGDRPLSSFEDPEALLDRIDEMSDEEVDALLSQVSNEDENTP